MKTRNAIAIKMVFFSTLSILVLLSSIAYATSGRGFINEPFDYDAFYDRYGHDEFITLGSPASTRYTQGWTNATYLSTGGGEQYTVVNCTNYAPARAEADNNSKTLQRFYLGSTVTVVGLWRDWAVCICDAFRDGYVCGWVNQRYLRPSDYITNDLYNDYSYNLDGTGSYIGDRYVVNCSEWVSLRLYADTSSERLARVPLGAKVNDCYEAENGFYFCEYNGITGYIQKKYLSKTPQSSSKVSTSSDRYDLSQYGYLPVITKGRGVLVFQSSLRGSFMSNHKFGDGDQIFVNLNWKKDGYAIAYEDGEYGYVDASYIDWGNEESNDNLKNNIDKSKDLSNYEYRQVVEKGRGALIFQKSPRGSFMKNFKYHDGDWIYVNLYWRKDGYAIAYENGTYGYVDASYIDW